MKNLKLVLALTALSQGGFFWNTYASDVHIQKGETVKVVIEGCKTSEYGLPVNAGLPRRNTDSITGKCIPKICSYYALGIFGSRITISPDGDLLAVTSSQSETRATIKRLIDSGVCASAEGSLGEL